MNSLATSIDIREWTHRLDTLGRALLNDQITALAWLNGMDELYGSLDLDRLLKSIDFGQMINNSAFDYIEQGRKFTHVQFLPETGEPANMVVETKATKVPKGASILPHAHLNMVSAFLTLSGEFHVRQFDRLHHDENVFHIRQTSDHLSQAGQWNSHSNDKNNVHWLTAMTDDSYLFSTKLEKVDPNQYGASNLWVNLNGKDLSNGVIQAERIDYDRAYELYG